MTASIRVVCIAIGILLLAAPAVNAESSQAESVCEAFDAARGKRQAFFSGFDATDFDDKSCARFCGELEKACNKGYKLRAKCVKIDDTFALKLAAALCDRDRECLDVVKEDKASFKEDAKQQRDFAKLDCEDIEADCLASCPGFLFP